MKPIKIKNYPNFYYLSDETEKFLTYEQSRMIKGKYIDIYVLDLKSKEFKPVKKTPIKNFTLEVRVTKVLDGKQRLKKKKYSFSKEDDLTILQALESLKVFAPDELLDQMLDESDKKKVKELVAAKQKADGTAAQSNKTLNDAWDEFYTHKTTGAKTSKWRDTTANTYKSFYKVWMRDTPLGETPVSDITKDDCISLVDKVHEQRTLRTATTVIEILRPMFDWYFDKYEIDRRNPAPSKKDYKLDNVRVVDISLAQVKKLYKVMDTYDDELMHNVFMWLRTGRRRGEIITLKMENIDTIDKTVLIEAEHNKAKVDMTYRLRPELEATLMGVINPKGTLFQVHKDTVTTHWGIIREKVGGSFKLNGKRVSITSLHLHDLRHIIAGVMKSAEVPEEIRGKVLGHKRQGITERYGLSYYGDIDRAYQLFLDIVYGVVPEDTKWGDR